MLLNKIRRRIFHRFFRPRLDEMLAPEHAIVLDYPVRVSPRYGYGKPPHPQIAHILESGRTEFATRLTGFCKLKKVLTEIPDEPSTNPIEPCWGPQRFFNSLDAAALYGMLVEFQPRRLIEVGSGYSTKFAHRAIRKHGLATQITSVDPEPRAEIDEICDCVIRKPLEEVDLTLFDELQSGDFLFIDSSHRTFTNSDVTIVFMELLPRLRPGVVVHIHDIFWPNDYLPDWNDRYYSEQYLLAAYLLGGGASVVKILMPNAFVVQDRDLAEHCKPLLEIPGFCPSHEDAASPSGFYGGSFWMQIAAGHNGRNARNAGMSGE